MATSEHLISTWACPNCPYQQSFDPHDQQLMTKTFPEARYQGLPAMHCPACFSGENPQRTKQLSEMGSISGSDLSRLFTRRVADDATLEATLIEDLDANGQPVMIQTGSRWELAVDQATGKVGSVEVPVYEPKMRSLTTKELAELKLQRDQNLDALESVAVREVTQTKEELK